MNQEVKKFTTIAMLFLLVCTTQLLSQTDDKKLKTPTLLQRTQAADVASQLLTHYCDRGLARVDVMHEYLNAIKKLDDFGKSKFAKQKTKPIMNHDQFMSIMNHYITYNNGGQFADPAINNFDAKALEKERQTLDKHNRYLFDRLAKARSEANAMGLYLASIDQFENYWKWTDEQLKKQNQQISQTIADQKALANPEDILSEIKSDPVIKKAIESLKAKQAGMSVEQYNQKMQQLLAQQDREAAEFASKQSKIGAHLVPKTGTGTGTPGTTPTTKPALRENWNGWKDSYSDVYNPRYGHVYRRYDKRINNDYDKRVNYESDRRTQLDADRRYNVHIDPRNNSNIPDKHRQNRTNQNRDYSRNYNPNPQQNRNYKRSY